MGKIVKKYNKPGKWEIVIPFEENGEEVMFLAVVDAREPGEYRLRVVADHLVRGTTGRIVVRAVVGVGARVELDGMIKIRREAQETDDFLELRVLMLGEDGWVRAEPRLEIEADNVKASHAASVGQVEKEQILYLMSRGLNENQAVDEIIKGFLMI